MNGETASQESIPLGEREADRGQLGRGHGHSPDTRRFEEFANAQAARHEVILKKLGAIENRLNLQIDNFHVNFHTRMEGVEERMDKLETQVDGLRTDVHTRIDGVLRFLESAGITPDNPDLYENE